MKENISINKKNTHVQGKNRILFQNPNTNINIKSFINNFHFVLIII